MKIALSIFCIVVSGVCAFKLDDDRVILLFALTGMITASFFCVKSILCNRDTKKIIEEMQGIDE